MPLVFGMDAVDAARALGAPLTYIKGRPGDEIFLAFRNFGGSGLFPNRHRLYLQFRGGRLAGWKGDWGHNWMWRSQNSSCAGRSAKRVFATGDPASIFLHKTFSRMDCRVKPRL